MPAADATDMDNHLPTIGKRRASLLCAPVSALRLCVSYRVGSGAARVRVSSPDRSKDGTQRLKRRSDWLALGTEERR